MYIYTDNMPFVAFLVGNSKELHQALKTKRQLQLALVLVAAGAAIAFYNWSKEHKEVTRLQREQKFNW